MRFVSLFSLLHTSGRFQLSDTSLVHQRSLASFMFLFTMVSLGEFMFGMEPSSFVYE